MVICLERGADLHMVWPMPLPLTVSCFTKIQIGFTFLVLAHPGSPGQRAIKRVCVWVLVHATVYAGISDCPALSRARDAIAWVKVTIHIHRRHCYCYTTRKLILILPSHLG